MYIFVGLGNPGEEYETTRHNVGRIVLDQLRKKFAMSEWESNKKVSGHVSEGKIGKEIVMLIKPDTFMNKSGVSVKPLITSAKKAHQLVVIYDDLDLPFGKIKISFNRSSGGHRGVESIIKIIQTEEFARVRVGISPTTPSGKLKKPLGEEKVEKHILGNFKKEEIDELKKISKTIAEALEVLVKESREKAMTLYN